MKVYIAADHAGYKLKEQLRKYLTKQHTIVDLSKKQSRTDDYPDQAKKLSNKIKDNTVGILICHSGLGICIAANKLKGIRAATIRTIKAAKLAKKHNNANVLCLGQEFTSLEKAKKIIDTFLNTKFIGNQEPRHQRRVNKITALES